MSASTGNHYTLVYINDPIDEDDDEGIEQVFQFPNAAEAEDWSEGVTAIKTVFQYFCYCLDEHPVAYLKTVAKDFVRMTFNFGVKWDFEVPQDVMHKFQLVQAWMERTRARESANARGD